MSGGRRDRAKSVFLAAMGRTSADRAAFVSEACAGDAALHDRVNALLAAHDEASAVFSTQRLATTLGDASDVERAGDRIGPYRLVESLGEGGFGRVFLADQLEPVRRQVAIKVIKPGMDSQRVVARFEAERQAMALMEHPSIARMLDAGATGSGRPYVVMELVRGRPITEYCDEHRADLRTRMEVFRQVCRAVHHAHQRGVIHRDLKPSNVLVTESDETPVPKIIDFGVAKALGGQLTEPALETGEHQLIGTPAYMSPEQLELAGLDVDIRADVYALGVMLYELLTGTLPFDPGRFRGTGLPAIQRIVAEEAPPTPSTRLSWMETSGAAGSTTAVDVGAVAGSRRTDVRTLVRAVRGDLDWVVMRCLEKDRARRYETANDLAGDIERHLQGYAVLAGPPSRIYRLRKLVRRHRAAVIAAAVAVTALVGATVVSVGFAMSEASQRRLAVEAGAAASREAAAAVTARRAEQREREKVEERERTLQAVSQFQADMLAAIDTELMGSRLREDVLAEGRAALRRARLDGGEIEARVAELQALLEGLNFTNAAVRSLDRNVLARAIEAIDEQFTEQPAVRAGLLQTVATIYRDLALYDAALGPQEEACRLRRETLGDDDPLTLWSTAELALLQDQRGEYETAAQLYRETLAGRERVLGPDHPDTLSSHNNVGLILQETGEPEAAEATLRDVLGRRERILGADHPDTLMSIANLGYVLEAQGRLDEAEPYDRLALERRRAVLGDDDPSTLTSLSNLGELLRNLGRDGEAEACHREALAGRRRILGDDHPDTLASVIGLAAVRWARGDLAGAEPLLQESLSTSQRTLGPLHRTTIRALSDLAGVRMNQGKLAEAEPMITEALARSRRLLGDEHLHTIIAIGNVGAMYRSMGRPAEAEPYMREALETSRRALGERHRITIVATYNLGSVLSLQERADEAEPLLRLAIEMAGEALGPDHPYVLASLYALGGLLIDADRLDDAGPVVEEALDRHRRALGETHRRTDNARLLHMRLLTALDDDAAAEPLGREILARQREAMGGENPDTLATMIALGEVLARLGAIDEAQPLLEEALATCREVVGAEHPLTIRAYTALIDLLVGEQRYAVGGPLAIEAAEAALARRDERGRSLLDRAVRCLDAWHAAEPDGGHDGEADDLRRRASGRGWDPR